MNSFSLLVLRGGVWGRAVRGVGGRVLDGMHAWVTWSGMGWTQRGRTELLGASAVYPMIFVGQAGIQARRHAAGTHLVRARPKSQILRSQLAFTSRLLGFKSLCRMLALWMYLSPLNSCGVGEQEAWVRRRSGQANEAAR